MLVRVGSVKRLPRRPHSLLLRQGRTQEWKVPIEAGANETDSKSWRHPRAVPDAIRAKCLTGTVVSAARGNLGIGPRGRGSPADRWVLAGILHPEFRRLLLRDSTLTVQP
jgi:hypothetical protein